MLDGITKKRIDTLRQILVGKLPDPKAQVEQITNGLIYKFMNDMDEESISMGGKSTYFSGKYQKYSWKNLLNTKTSGIEKLSLYSEAIEQMYNNENLPELFREIFKNSFLPFKDPSTLNMFLKEINEFHYSNSEKLGDAFEYLLSLMGSQGDAGQFRTPRHIIDFIVEIVNPQKNETILDPACGTAGFLISSYKHILKQNTKKNLGDGLTASDRKKIGENLNGYDISPDMVKMSLVNMYLHKFTNPKISEYDTLSSEDRWNEYYDVILANPPFFSPKGGIMPHNRFGVKSTKAEVLFVDYINEHLKPNGRAGIIIPEGIIFQTGIAYKQLRKRLLETSLLGVISLPPGVFNPYSGVKTSILILDKSFNKKTDDIFFFKIDSDGFSLGAQRNEQIKNDIPECISLLKKFLEQKTNSRSIKKGKINLENDYTYSYEKLSSKQIINSNYDFKDLSEVADFIRGITFSKNDRLNKETDNSVKIATTRASQDDGIKEEHLNIINKNFVKNDEQYLKDKDILISLANSLDLVGRTTFIKDINYKISFGTFMGCIRAKNNLINPNLLNYFLKSPVAKEFFRSHANTTTNISNLNFKTIGKLKLPVPPIETQNQIVEELDGYQRIIDGCRQVIENYKPSIDIDPTWEMIELGNIGEIISGGTPNTKISEYWNGNIEWLTLVDLPPNEAISYIENSKRKITKLGLEKSSAKIIPKNSVIVSTRATIGRTGINKLEVTTNQGFKSIVIDKEKYIPEYIAIQIYLIRDYLKSIATGGTFGEISKSNFEKIKISVPSIEIQNDIVKNFKEDISIIEQNQRLLEKLEKKNQNRISKIWSS
jgi:type I restriction enzyme M protein